MAIELVTKYSPLVDELFATESKFRMVTNTDYEWTGAHTVKVYKVSTASMTDYGRSGPAEGNWSRYGEVEGLDATTEELTLRKDRSFTFAIDKLDTDETGGAVAAGSALARQQRQVIIPEIDSYVFGIMANNAGNTEYGELSKDNIYAAILDGTEALDNAEVPEGERFLIVSPSVYQLMKKSQDIVLDTNIGQDMRLKGVIANLDGLTVVRVPASRLPENCGFIMAHPVATVAPVKLEDYRIHLDPPGISGSLVEGRICYDAFVLDNKANAVYYHVNAAEESNDESAGQE